MKNKNNIKKSILSRLLYILKPKDRAKFLLAELYKIKLIRVVLLALMLLLIALFVFFFIKKPVPQQNINYGVNFSKKYAEELGLDWKETYIKILDELKAKNLRVVAYWNDIEREQGKYDFSDIVWQLEEADKRGVSVIVALGRKVPRYPECFEPDWWKNLHNETMEETHLYNFVETTIKTLRAHQSVVMWQVENEPFFPFGDCKAIKRSTIKNEIEIVRKIDGRPVLVQDSGEGGFWLPSYTLGDYLGISMYRKVWYDFWGFVLKKFVYFQYPLAHWSYKIKSDIVGVPFDKIIVTELQAEPWGPLPNHLLSDEERDKTMSRQDFLGTISYAQKSGVKDLYFWGAEWWIWEKERENNPFYWDTAKALFN